LLCFLYCFLHIGCCVLSYLFLITSSSRLSNDVLFPVLPGNYTYLQRQKLTPPNLINTKECILLLIDVMLMQTNTQEPIIDDDPFMAV
jgi:hypothetical protein